MSGAYINVYDGSSVESFNGIVAGVHVQNLHYLQHLLSSVTKITKMKHVCDLDADLP